MRTLLISMKLIAAVCAGYSGGVAEGFKGWHPPVMGVIRDGKAAISIARTVWISGHPDLEGRIGSESVWQRDMQATLHDGVWEVTAKPNPDPNVIGGALFIYIAQSDGHVVGIYLTQ